MFVRIVPEEFYAPLDGLFSMYGQFGAIYTAFRQSISLAGVINSCVKAESLYRISYKLSLPFNDSFFFYQI